MKLSDFDYQLPKELIAQYPLKSRDSCRLLVIERSSQKIYHDKFYNILKYLPKNSCLILNDSRVIPARLLGRREKTGGRVEVLVLNQVDSSNTFNALINPLKKIKIDERIIFNGSKIYCQLIDAKQKIVRFNCDILKHLKEIGQIPLPPYIKRVPENLDKEYYQTVYAKCNGSIASPTAGLHFTNELLSKIKETEIKIASLTLHVNYATFNPVKEEDITRHKMYCEEFRVTRGTVKIIQEAKESSRKIIAVGTTSCRVLETISNIEVDKLNNSIYQGSTNLFIYPGYKFKLTDGIITNFHFPKTTLFMLVCAFAGGDLIMKAYQEAIAKKYRFYSYGDAMLII
ncbi:MAG: tRNA preQ1(34) S-adenosylmethionine ribosyltransferase-isomerase QueA [Candidatus Omnitrophota bacterium]|nr:tRNA preQ1(34) S-adenosylmethionine ribosyltransferase-isomerase QueA [Candidatus Omnitrophota bacterium]